MKKDSFSNKIYCEFIIVSDIVDSSKLTEDLNISPERSFRKGDTYKSKSSGSLVSRPHNLWAISSKVIALEKVDIQSHISHIKSILEDKMDILRKFKSDQSIELSFWIWVETEDSGIGIDLLESDISFINKVSNRVHLSIITDSSIN